MLLRGYFSAKLKSHQQRWLPYEVKAFSISAAVNHWGPFIIKSHHPTQILIDSKPSLQAFEKLQRGECSNSAQVTSFLATLSKYNIQLQHIAGTANLPADCLSLSPIECEHRDL